METGDASIEQYPTPSLITVDQITETDLVPGVVVEGPDLRQIDKAAALVAQN